MKYFYSRESQIRTTWYPSGIMASRSDDNSNEYRNWDSTGSLKTYRCNKFSKKWGNGVLKEHFIKDTLGFSNVTYTYKSDGYEVKKIKERVNKNKYYQVLEVYSSGNKLLSVDSAELFYEYEPEETNEVFEFFDLSESPNYNGGQSQLNSDLIMFLEHVSIKKPQKGIYSLRLETNSFGDVVQVKSISSAKKGEGVTKKLEDFFLQSKWKPAGRYDVGVKSKLLVELAIK